VIFVSLLDSKWGILHHRTRRIFARRRKGRQIGRGRGLLRSNNGRHVKKRRRKKEQGIKIGVKEIREKKGGERKDGRKALEDNTDRC
jgi:hypothetical protein